MSRWESLTGTFKLDASDAPAPVRELLTATMPPLARHICAYAEHEDDAGFAYRERQFHSFLLPAFRDVAEVVFREQPIQRRRGNDSRRGRLDYWIERAGKIFLVEVKHGFLHTTRPVRRRELKKWQETREQMASVVESAPELLADGRKAHVIGLMVFVHYCKGDKRGKSVTGRDACWDRHQRLLLKLDEGSQYPVRWSATWRLPRRHQRYRWSDGEETYPALSLVAATAKTARGTG